MSPILQATQAWLEHAVIGLNLCPFAKAVHVKNQIRYVPSPAQDEQALMDTLCTELHYLAEANPDKVDTTLIIHPEVFTDFLDFNEFLSAADEAIDTLGYSGILQIASFHPQFQFAGTAVGDITNATNQSPYPMLHILRESSIERAVNARPQAEEIFEANIATLEALGTRGWADLKAQAWDI
jgi:uncharacterized protein